MEMSIRHKKRAGTRENILGQLVDYGKCVAYIFISEKELETLLNAAFFGTVDHDFDH